MTCRACTLTVALFVSALLAGCTSARLEYDRMTGTAFPQAETVSSETVNLTTIYLQGDILLIVDENDTNIAPLTGPPNPADPDQYDYLTLAELETVENANRISPVDKVEWSCGFWIFKTTCTRYHLYGIVVNHYAEIGGVERTDLMGWMFDPVSRSAFVNFYKHSTNSGNNAKYLRSTAHEAGHAFNLSHCDGDGSTTIMNQTRIVGDTFNYEFSSGSLDHLQNHPKSAVWPGIGPRHYACPHVH